jgi:hypothetical protein
MATNVWMYRETVLPDPTADLVGYDVEAADGHIGKIDEASVDAGRQFVVVDTGFWIFGKKRLIPAGVIERVDYEDRKAFLSMTKEQVKSAPDYDEERTADDDVYYDKFGSYYGDYRS